MEETPVLFGEGDLVGLGGEDEAVLEGVAASGTAGVDGGVEEGGLGGFRAFTGDLDASGGKASLERYEAGVDVDEEGLQAAEGHGDARFGHVDAGPERLRVVGDGELGETPVLEDGVGAGAGVLPVVGLVAERPVRKLSGLRGRRCR